MKVLLGLNREVPFRVLVSLVAVISAAAPAVALGLDRAIPHF